MGPGACKVVERLALSHPSLSRFVVTVLVRGYPPWVVFIIACLPVKGMI